MEQFHCTERQLREEFTLKRIREIGVYNEIIAQVRKEQESKNR